MREPYFAGILDRQRELRAHGFAAEPTEDELVDYAFNLDDKLSALCESIGVELAQDVRGK